MGQGSSEPRKSYSRTIRLRANEAVPRTSEQYQLVGIRINGEFDIGVSSAPEDGESIDQFPQTVSDVLPDMAAETIDMDRLRAETTEENWPVIGMVTLSRIDGETVDVSIEWVPS